MQNVHLFHKGVGQRTTVTAGRRTVSRGKLPWLADSDDYECVKKRLRDRYAPEGNEIEW